MDGKLGKMWHYGGAGRRQVEARFAQDERIVVAPKPKSSSVRLEYHADYPIYKSEPVFLPTKEVLSLLKGISAIDADQKTIKSIFDDTYLDLCSALTRSNTRKIDNELDRNPRFGVIIPRFVESLGGRYEFENGNYFFQPGYYKEIQHQDEEVTEEFGVFTDKSSTVFVSKKGSEISNNMTAEGFRKLGLLQQILSNRSLSPGLSGPLFWDEPEANMNPKLMKLVVEILLELARNGQQIILATHDYVLLKWFDLLMDKGKDDHVRFHALFRNAESNEIKVESTDDYNLISKSAISDTFAELYDEDVKRALG